MGAIECARISATGPDGAGKDTAWRQAKPYLPNRLKILKIGKPSSIVWEGREKYLQVGESKLLDRLHGWADSTKNPKLTSLVNGLYVMFQWGFQERYWAFRVYPDVVFSLRDGYADPAAYAPFYMPETLGRMDVPDRIKVLHSMHASPFRKKTVFLDISPQVAVERIDLRMAKEANSKPVGLIRPKWKHQHENVADLGKIRSEFVAVLAYLRDNCGTEVVSLDVGDKSKDEVGRFLAQAILAAV